MLNLLERHAASIEARLTVLAPRSVRVPGFLQSVTADCSRRQALLHQVQRLRGAVYLEDGAIVPSQLTADGRHVTAEDEKAWHFVTRDSDGRLTSCSWYLEYPDARSIRDLRVRSCPLRKDREWKDHLQSALLDEMTAARDSRIPFAEVGGWAVAKDHRCTSNALLHVFAMYSLSLSLGGAIGLATATVRHSSAQILRRLGMAPLSRSGTAVPVYYDPKYSCEMELLRFDTRQPSARYRQVIETLRDRLENVAVVADRMPMPTPATVRVPAFEPSYA